MAYLLGYRISSWLQDYDVAKARVHIAKAHLVGDSVRARRMLKDIFVVQSGSLWICPVRDRTVEW